MRYLSQEWKDAAWKSFEETRLAGNDSDCGWGRDGPCGGCGRCMTAQFGYYLNKKIEEANVFLSAGFDVADPTIINIGWMPGFIGAHDSRNCRMSGERTEWSFPWKKASK